MSITLEHSDLKRLRNKWTKAGKAAREFNRAFWQREVSRLLEIVKEKTPRDTGLLRESWEIFEEGDIIGIKNEVEYAFWVEYGHHLILPSGIYYGYIEPVLMMDRGVHEWRFGLDRRYELAFYVFLKKQGLAE